MSFSKTRFLVDRLLSVQIARVDPERSAEAVEAVHSSLMTFCALANTFGVSFGLLQKRISRSVGIAGRVGLHRKFDELRRTSSTGPP